MRFHIHHYFKLPPEVLDKLDDILRNIDLILKNTETIMSDETDLASAVADLATAIAANNTEIDTLLTKITTPGVSPVAVQAAVTSIRALIKTNADEVAKAQAAAP
jgi:hypothetical protein